MFKIWTGLFAGICLGFICLTLTPNLKGQNGNQVFTVVVENKFGQAVRVNRVWDNPEGTHIAKDLVPGETVNATVEYRSDQVFIVWHDGELVDKPLKFNPRDYERIVITVTTQRTLTVQLAARKR